MWHDGPLILKTCPVRYLTADAEAAVGLFRRCYDRHGESGIGTWRRVSLPNAGGVADQDAWTMAAIEFVRDVMNRLEVDLWKAARRATAAATDPTEDLSIHG